MFELNAKNIKDKYENVKTAADNTVDKMKDIRLCTAFDTGLEIKSQKKEVRATSEVNAKNIELIETISAHTSFIAENVEQMIENRKVANRIENVREKAIAYHDTVAPMLESIRYHVDKLELIVDDEIWPLPKYRELLFIR